MEISSLFSLPEGVEITSMTVIDNILTLHLVATAPCAACPLCAQDATRIRSYYTRTVADVSCMSRHVQCILRVRKFRCETGDCPRRVFAERLSPFIEPWARMTNRLSHTIAVLGLATCGELAERLAPSLGIRTSSTTVLRRIMALPTPSPEHVSLLGIDDWSFRRGRKFGTLLVDFATHTVIDVLPDRKTETAAAWMQGPNPAKGSLTSLGNDNGTVCLLLSSVFERKQGKRSTQTTDFWCPFRRAMQLQDQR